MDYLNSFDHANDSICTFEEKVLFENILVISAIDLILNNIGEDEKRIDSCW